MSFGRLTKRIATSSRCAKPIERYPKRAKASMRSRFSRFLSRSIAFSRSAGLSRILGFEGGRTPEAILYPVQRLQADLQAQDTSGG